MTARHVEGTVTRVHASPLLAGTGEFFILEHAAGDFATLDHWCRRVTGLAVPADDLVIVCPPEKTAWMKRLEGREIAADFGDDLACVALTVKGLGSWRLQ